MAHPPCAGARARMMAKQKPVKRRSKRDEFVVQGTCHAPESRSVSAVSVKATKRRDTADLLVALASLWTPPPAGSKPLKNSAYLAIVARLTIAQINCFGDVQPDSGADATSRHNGNISQATHGVGLPLPKASRPRLSR